MILIDVTRLTGRLLKGRVATGIDRVDLAYVEHYAPRARAVVRTGLRTSVLSAPASRRVFGELLDGGAASRGRMLGHVASGALKGRFEPVRAGSVYFNTGHSGLERPDTMNRLRRRGLRPVFMVHDLIPITHHEFCRAGERERHVRRMTTVLESAEAVLTVSRSTLSALTEFATRLSRPLPPAHVVPLAPGLQPTAPGPRPLAEPYFVVVATIEPRKNLAFLLKVWRRLAERHGERAPRLVLVGQRGWECENVLDLLERCEPLRPLVIERRGCPDAELANWLHHAQALLFPSLAEGYGLPLIEALQSGTPVIASALPVFREVAGEVPEYLDPLDGPAWLDAIERYATEGSPARAAQRVRMASFRAPTWREHFAVVDELIDGLRAAFPATLSPALAPA